ncbi:hypothetical protein N8380_03995 [Planktomarina temperata]|nr:hypothetical protein [Planktomarina temperata]
MTRRATGPITAEGKAVSAQNARKHGLSAEPAADPVAAWFNIILDNCEDAYEEPNTGDPRQEAALRLAVAEARYHRALDRVDTHDREPNSAQQVANKLHTDIDDVLDRMPKSYSDGPPDPFELQYVNFAIKELEMLLGEVGRERRLYRRYFGEARAQRRKALRAWCAYNRDENLNSRNELELQLREEQA